MFKTAFQTMVIHKYIDEIGIYEAVRKVKEIGYNAVEISGHFECSDAFVSELCRARDDFGVEVCALNVAFNGQFPVKPHPLGEFRQLTVLDRFDDVVDFCNRLGCRYVRCAGLPAANLDTADKVRQYCAVTEDLCRRLAAHGLKLCIHNHDTEFCKVEGKFLFDWLFELAPSVFFEFDVKNALFAGMNPEKLMDKIAGRMPLIHFEDLKVLPLADPRTKKVVGCAPGEGNIDMPAFLDQAARCGNEYMIVEMSNFFGMDVYDGMKLAAENMKAAGYADTF